MFPSISSFQSLFLFVHWVPICKDTFTILTTKITINFIFLTMIIKLTMYQLNLFPDLTDHLRQIQRFPPPLLYIIITSYLFLVLKQYRPFSVKIGSVLISLIKLLKLVLVPQKYKKDILFFILVKFQIASIFKWFQIEIVNTPDHKCCLGKEETRQVQD